MHTASYFQWTQAIALTAQANFSPLLIGEGCVNPSQPILSITSSWFCDCTVCRRAPTYFVSIRAFQNFVSGTSGWQTHNKTHCKQSWQRGIFGVDFQMAPSCAKESESLGETSEAWPVGQRGAVIATLWGQGVPGSAWQTGVGSRRVLTCRFTARPVKRVKSNG